MKMVAKVMMQVEIPNEKEFREYIGTLLSLDIETTEDAITELIASWVLRNQYDMNFPDVKVIPTEILLEEVGDDLH